MAYLERVRSKGKTYLYLKEYAVRSFYENQSITIYRFGRIEKARNNIKKWKNDMNLMPEKLKEMGFCQQDLKKWIKRIS